MQPAVLEAAKHAFEMVSRCKRWGLVRIPAGLEHAQHAVASTAAVCRLTESDRSREYFDTAYGRVCTHGDQVVTWKHSPGNAISSDALRDPPGSNERMIGANRSKAKRAAFGGRYACHMLR